MKHTDEAMHEFMEIYKAEFGKELSPQEALEMVTRLVNLYQIIYRPLPEELNSMQPSEELRAPDVAFPKAE